MLATNHESLPDTVWADVKKFFKDNENWLTRLFLEEQETGDFEFRSDEAEIEKSVLSSLVGAMVIAESMD